MHILVFLFHYGKSPFFFLAGTSCWFALETKSRKQYLIERLRRIAIPLVFGVAVINPAAQYLSVIAKGNYTKSFPSFYVSFFIKNYCHPNVIWQHLWFLAYLLFFTILLLPLVAIIKDKAIKTRIARVAGLFSNPPFLYLLSLPLIMTEFLLRINNDGNNAFINDWAGLLFYSVIFLYGFLLSSDMRFFESIVTYRWVSCFMSGICLGCLLYSIVVLRVPSTEKIIASMIYYGFSAFASFALMLTFLGFFGKHMNFFNGFVRYAMKRHIHFISCTPFRFV